MVPAQVEANRIGTIHVDLFDTRNTGGWPGGHAADAVSEKPDKNTKKLNKAIKQMFESFPPPSASQHDNTARARSPVGLSIIGRYGKTRQ
jgi:hypothetical protein